MVQGRKGTRVSIFVRVGGRFQNSPWANTVRNPVPIPRILQRRKSFSGKYCEKNSGVLLLVRRTNPDAHVMLTNLRTSCALIPRIRGNIIYAREASLVSDLSIVCYFARIRARNTSFADKKAP
eukprot:scaffold5540_cov96-Cylindrotheca_fusiformis.AAC.9